MPKCGGASIVRPYAHARFSCNHGAASVCALMAGACAEVVAFGSYDEIGFQTDAQRAEERLQRLGYTDGGAALWDRTLTLVRQHLGRIEWLAVHLQYAQTLDGHAIDDIVRRGCRR